MSRRNTQLAQRIADILIRLNNGETLFLVSLAHEYEVSSRTIRRDLEDRLAFQGIHKDTATGGYSLPLAMRVQFDSNSIELYSCLTGIKGLFPALDKKMLNMIFNSSGQHNFLVHGHKYISDETQSTNFPRLQGAIDEQRVIEFRYLRQNTWQTYRANPYKLINYNGIWYLAALHENKIKHFTLSKIANLNCTFDVFTRDSDLLDSIHQEDSVWASEEKFEVILKVSPTVAEYFQRRNLLNKQVIEKEMEDGGLILSTKISHKTEIMPIVQYWIPHMKIISPESLQKELENSIKNWLED